MMKGVFSVLSAVLVLSLFGQTGGQKEEEERTQFPIFSIAGGIYAPQGDMEQRFGNFSGFSMALDYKLQSNWTFGLDYHQFFNNDVREPNLMSNLFTDNGFILDVQGQASTLRIQGRATSFTANVGRLFPVKSRQSGIWLKLGLGYTKHKIRLEHQVNDIRQLEDEYLKGYDRLTRGLVVKSFLGYIHMSPNKRINYFIGVDFGLGFTDPARPINYDTQVADAPNRVDGLLGIQAGWVLPIRKRVATKYYVD